MFPPPFHSAGTVQPPDTGHTGPPAPVDAIWLCAFWPVPVLLYWLLDFLARRRRLVLRDPDPPDSAASSVVSDGAASTAPPLLPDDTTVLLASIEHVMPHLGVKAQAGGLGKVVELITKHHPTEILMVHPMLGDQEYGEADAEEPLELTVDGRHERVHVFRREQPMRLAGSHRVVFITLSHPTFLSRRRKNMYPQPITRRAALQFYSLWNQAVGALLARHRPRVFHCPDFHASIAPWYSGLENLRMVLVLHNAEYQGSVSTSMMNKRSLRCFANIFNVSEAFVQQRLTQEGRFNMLKAAVDYILERQAGKGVCAVSKYYAWECFSSYSLLWRLPTVEGIDNPMLQEEHADLSGQSLAEAKAAAKARVQERFRLRPADDARLFVSVGRLVRQKGVDVLADVAPWLLATYPEAQLVIAGPVGDGFGHYAGEKLRLLTEDPRFAGRVAHCTDFIEGQEVKDLRLGADFCLMPSRSEPFGYVDIEFAWCGALVVGAQAGGLGKVPGFYYVCQNSENLGRLRREVRTAISRAMAAAPRDLQAMSVAALRSRFPVQDWQARLLGLYAEVLQQQQPPPPAPPRRSAAALLQADGPALHEQELPPAGRGQGDASAAPAAADPAAAAAAASPPPAPPVGELRAALTGDDEEDDGGEFLIQELDEEELARRVRDKVAEHPSMPIDEILEAVSIDKDVQRERGRLGRWLLGSTFGVTRTHLLVACGYIASPVAEFFTFVTATEWGMRGVNTKETPRWIGGIPVLGTFLDKINPSFLSMLLFSTNALAYAMAAPFWAAASRRVQPRRLLAASMLLHLWLVLTSLPVRRPNVLWAILLVFVNGLVTSSSLLFVVFNFLTSIKADMSRYALRMGVMEMLRNCVSWVLCGYIFIASPSSQGGTVAKPLPMAVTWLLAPILWILLCITLVPAILLLAAPGPYREDFFPGWDLRLCTKKLSFVLLSLSDCVGYLTLYPGSCYISWFLANGWKFEELAELSVVFAVLLMLGTLLWAGALSLASVHGFSLLIGTVLLLPPASMLRAVAQEEAATVTFMGRSTIAVVIVVVSLLFEGIRSSAFWTAKIRILNSRWRLLSYGTVLQTISHACGFLSPIICENIAKSSGATFITANQKELADAIIICVVPLGILQIILQTLAAPFIYWDMGVAVGAERQGLLCGWPRLRLGDHHTALCRRRARKVLANSPLALALPICAAICATIWMLEGKLLGRQMQVDPIYSCTGSLLNTTAITNCSVVLDEIDPRPAQVGWSYGLNKYGMPTTGLYNCLMRMREVGGDTFVFEEYGRCRVQLCGSAEQLLASVVDTIFHLPGQQVWSRHCTMSSQNNVVVHLFEWRWTDVAGECETYLGPAGFTGVQVSPPAEHVPGDSWSVRYQPVSYRLESRGGTRVEFVDMVARCHRAGVAVMVDAVLNHMSGPYVFAPKKDRGKHCGATQNTTKTSTARCVGWAGTEYKNRAFPHSREGLDAYVESDFHHYPGTLHSNCGLPPWHNNQHLCDLYGLPDLDTESVRVQRMLQGYLLELFEIGVTMLRLDAAMSIYPESMAMIVPKFPWKYLVQEYYPGNIETDNTRHKALEVGHLTEFNFGLRVAQSLFDSFNGGRWENRSYAFAELLTLGQIWNPEKACPYNKDTCGSPYPQEMAMLFIDNHDSQRERWKPHDTTNKPACGWDGKDIGNCRPMYKHGREYHMAQRFLLLWPYGDAVRLMSSFAWEKFDDGPPGVRRDSLYDKASSPVVCRGTPDTSPVTDEYDSDTAHPWVCEHHWSGVAGLVRLRRTLGGRRSKATALWSDPSGHLAFSLTAGGADEKEEKKLQEVVAFVAMNRGYNIFTKQGLQTDLNLTNRSAPGIPSGVYCNLAQEYTAVPQPGLWGDRDCAGDHIVVRNGTIRFGIVRSSDIVAIHRDFVRTRFTSSVEEEAELLAV